MKSVVRIGCGAGALIDSTIGTPQLINHGEVDYIVFDYMAELATQMYARAMQDDPSAGYSKEFTEWIWKDNVEAIARSGIKVVVSAGGLNVQGCCRRMAELARSAGVEIKIATVEGDDVLHMADGLAAQGLTDLYNGAPLPGPAQLKSLNAYLGAAAVASALAQGADVVVTGRVADSALALGPLVHEFGWGWGDYDLLAAGSLAGHVIECGPQSTGGIFTDWEIVPDWAHIGYPVVECHPDGSFILTKPPNTGGLCSVGTVSEQILYEIGDPAQYILPDVVCDFTQVRVKQVGKDRVHVSGARGRQPTRTYKVCGTYTNAFRAVGVFPIIGKDAVAKAKRQAVAILERVSEMILAEGLGPFQADYVEILGSEGSYGARADGAAAREVICKIVVDHQDRRALDIFHRESRSALVAMAPGNTGWFPGQPLIQSVVGLFSFLLDKDEVEAKVSIGPDTWPVLVAAGVGGEIVAGPLADEHDIPEPLDQPSTEVPLRQLAWARSGDKGDKFNIGVIAREPSLLPFIRAALTARRVEDFFAHEFDGIEPAGVDRYDVPGLNALNFVVHGALGGGGMASPRLDAMGKGKAQQILDFMIAIPASMAVARSTAK